MQEFWQKPAETGISALESLLSRSWGGPGWSPSGGSWPWGEMRVWLLQGPDVGWRGHEGWGRGQGESDSVQDCSFENWGQGRDSASHGQRRQETWKSETKSWMEHRGCPSKAPAHSVTGMGLGADFGWAFILTAQSNLSELALFGG